MKFAQGGRALEKLAGANSRPRVATPRRWRTITVGTDPWRERTLEDEAWLREPAPAHVREAAQQTLLFKRAGSSSWAPDSKNIVFHASASGAGVPIKNDMLDCGAPAAVGEKSLQDFWRRCRLFRPLLTTICAPRRASAQARANDEPDFGVAGFTADLCGRHDAVADFPVQTHAARVLEEHVGAATNFHAQV